MAPHPDPNPSIAQPIAESRSHPSNPDRKRFLFQHTWFDDFVRPEWEEHISHLRGKRLSILEVGSFEGASTTWLLDNLMSHPDSTLIAVDTFEGGMEHQDAEQAKKYGLATLEQRFRSNVSQCIHSDRLTVMKSTSEEALLRLREERAKFDLIYIDASHIAIDVLHDAVLSWRMLSLGGTLIFDDFAWKGYMEDCYNPRIAILSFLRCAAPEIETRETEGQLWVTKVLRRFEATPNPDPALYYWKKESVDKNPLVVNGQD